MEENKFGFDEIIDTVSDMVKAEIKAQSSFKGKFDIVKVLSWALSEYPTIREAVEDWPIFEQEINDLFADESIDALKAIQAKLSEQEMQKSRIYKTALFAARGHKNTITVKEIVEEQLALGAAIFSK